jgi:MFS family permease
MISDPNEPGSKRSNDAYAALRLPQYRLFTFGRNIAGAGDGMKDVVVGWELYARTHNPMTLGWVGIVQASPILLFALLAGHVADTYHRKYVAAAGQFLYSLCIAFLAYLSLSNAPIPYFYLCLFLGISARTFGNPARTALLPQIVPIPMLGNAVSWDTSIRRVAVMSGAAIGGWLLDWTGKSAFVRGLPIFAAAVHSTSGSHHEGFPSFVYLTTAALGMISVVMLLQLHVGHETVVARQPITWDTLVAGIRYIRSTRIVLATISLDLFAVLFGGATTLLPVYARDILRVGPEGLGWLRAAPSAGALVMALTTAHMPPMRFPGRSMLWAVVGFGVATIVFGFSRSMTLSIVALVFVGGLDMVSVVVRQTLIQTLTPNEMRGRVNAVNAIFINSSNELGGFESGVIARLFGTVFSVVSGGIASIMVTAAAAQMWPALRNYNAHEHQTSLEVWEEQLNASQEAGLLAQRANNK